MKEKKEEAEYASQRGEGSKTALGIVPVQEQGCFSAKKTTPELPVVVKCRFDPLWIRLRYKSRMTLESERSAIIPRGNSQSVLIVRCCSDLSVSVHHRFYLLFLKFISVTE